jgi:predicted DNA-binding transcriptional regulator YafY
MRADRLLSILLLLQVQRRLTARELAERLRVSARTIHRDMEALSGAGVPVVAERGAGGGWHLLEEYRTNLTGLSDAEVQALFLASPGRLFTDLGLAEAADGALIKLLAALPIRHRGRAEDIQSRIHIDLAGWRQVEGAVPTLPTLQEAIWGERQLRIGYCRSDGREVERTVAPLGLVAKGSLWYLIAAHDGEPRTYRVSRIATATLLDATFTRPPGFDLAAFWAQSSSAFITRLPQYQVTVRVAPATLRSIRLGGRYARIAQEGVPDADGWSTMQIDLETEAWAREFVLGFGAELEILNPPDLRAYVVHEAEMILARYRAADQCLGQPPLPK